MKDRCVYGKDRAGEPVDLSRGSGLAAQSLHYTAEQTQAGCIYTVKLPDVRYWTAVWVQPEDR